MKIAELIHSLARFDPETKVVMAHNWEAPQVTGMYMDLSAYHEGEEPTVVLHIGEIEAAWQRLGGQLYSLGVPWDGTQPHAPGQGEVSK